MTVQMNISGSGLGGTIEGGFGTYLADVNGNITVDPRDVPALLTAGCSFLRKASSWWTPGNAPAAAAAAAWHTSGALSNATLAISAQPDVSRQGAVVVNAGTSAITAGNFAFTYLSNDGQAQTDNNSLVTAASGTLTFFTSKGVVHITSMVVTALAGGASPGVQVGSTAMLCVPCDPGAGQTVTFNKTVVDGADEAVGTVSTTTLGGITPTTAPNATHTYAFAYTYLAPTV